MRLLFSMHVALISMSVCLAEWTPPDNPDPREIKNSIRDDIDRGRYEIALDKHVWFHDNAVKLQPSLAGVRLSFAMSSWLELGEVYPPALKKMKDIRDELDAKIRDQDRVRVRFEDFHDFTAFNRTLRQEERTVETFIWLNKNDPEDAARVFNVAQDALIKQREYDLVAKLLEPEKDVRRFIEIYRRNLSMSEKFGESFMAFTENTFANEATTLVAILVHAKRSGEAQQAAQTLLDAVEDPEFAARVQREMKPALEGKVPTPFP